jgi:hypothetical protein
MLFLINQLFGDINIDYMFTLGCLLSVRMENGSNVFKNTVAMIGKDYERLQKIARIGSVAGSIWNQRIFQVKCMDLVRCCRWLHEFRLLGKSF